MITLDWVALGATALLVGMTKTGLAGLSMIALPILATLFGGRASSGMVLVLLIFGDVFGVFYYHRDAEWKHLVRLFPWAFVGVVLGVVVGGVISDAVFRLIMGIVILGGTVLIIVQEVKGSNLIPQNSWWVPVLLGIAGGFTTMIGNAAGPIMTLYLLSMALPKNAMIGTGAWYFFVINLVKVPFHVFAWSSITVASFLQNLTVAPLVLVGALLGVRIVKLIPERPYRIFVIVMTSIAAIRLFFP